MTTVAFVFPGQGSQHAGMGDELLKDPETAELAARCSEAAGIDLRHLLTEAGDGELTLTANAQPALVFTGVAVARRLTGRGLRPAACAGHSVGEYTALCAAGAIAPEEVVSLVVERGRAMESAAPPGSSSLMAVLGLDPAAVAAALAGLPGVWPVNFNTPTQVVVGGATARLEEAAGRLREAGARRVLPLKVAAAFHTPLMAAAASRLRAALERVAWRAPEVPVVANLDAQPYRAAAEIPLRLERQLTSPVRWEECVRRLAGDGCDTFYELGGRRVLTGMMRELAPGADARALGAGALEQVK